VRQLTDLTFAEFVGANRFAVVHFWATWNRYDDQMREVLERQIPSSRRDRVSFAAIDIDPEAHWSICRELGVMNLPFLAFYREGVVFQTETGLRTPEQIVSILERLTA
jgi:thioredoxin-like negative regulator of GroEL